MTDPNDPSAAADPLALEDCDYDRKYLLVSVPDFDIDPVEGDGKRRMTSYLRLGTVPDDWKSLPGAELELAVHADYGIGGGRGDDRPIGQQVPGTPLPADPTDPRYVAPSPTSLFDRFAEAVRAALAEAAALPEVQAWATAEEALVAQVRPALAVPSPFVASPDAPAPQPPSGDFPARVGPEHFLSFVLEDCAGAQSTVESRLDGLALGGPTAPLDDRAAGEVVATMGLRSLADLVIRAKAAGDVPWTALAVSQLAAALAAVRADAASRAAPGLVEALTDYPDMLLANGEPKFPPFVDDLRYRGDPGDETNYLPHEDRFRHSKHLHTRGGWRDHSDGNRISTTYGDKVEVIRGNYKLMVLGRQDDPSSSNLVDYGGQVTQSDDNVLVRVEYIKQDGVWNWQTVNENVIQSEKVSGKVYSWWYGVEQIDVVGSEDPTPITDDNPMGLNADGLSRANPNLTSRTWARKTWDYTGSARCPVEKSYAETWVDDDEEKTTVTNGTISTTTIGGGTIETTTIGGGTISTTTVGGGTLDTTTVGGAAISLEAVVGAKVDITGVAATIIELTTSLTKFEVAAHLVHVEASAVGLHAEIKVVGIDIEIARTGLKIESTKSGKKIELGDDETETVGNKSETYMKYDRTSVSDKLNYSTSSETGASKSLSLSDLRVVAASISLG